MKTIKNYINIIGGGALLLTSTLIAGCASDEIDNAYSRNKSVIQLSPSAEFIKLDESRPDETALTIEWNPAYEYGNEYITTYQFQMDATGSKANPIKEYEDDGRFRREYTNRELQELLINHFGALTSTLNTLNLQITASFEGPRTVVPDIATTSVRIKTYGAKQFMADSLYIGGEAAGGEPILLNPTAANPNIYSYNGPLSAGKVNFPVIYADEKNAIGPESPDSPLTNTEMACIITDQADANFWIIPEEGNYRITVNIDNKTVKIVPAGSVIELDRLFMAGSAVGTEEIEIQQTLENSQLYAWRGALKAGSLYMPILFNDAKAVSIIPKDKSSHDIHDGQSHEFDQTSTESGTSTAYWQIPADGIYRIVVNLEEHSITIRSAATDIPNTTVSYNNTVAGINPFTQEVTELWMWGGFNASAHDDNLKAGFQAKYKLKQSLADPNVFVYHGEVLPRSGSTCDWSKATATGALNFLVSSIENNVYAFGSTADAVRNKNRGYLTVKRGETLTLVPGQSNNRYAYFCIPENCNFVVVDIKKLTVVFDTK